MLRICCDFMNILLTILGFCNFLLFFDMLNDAFRKNKAFLSLIKTIFRRLELAIKVNNRQ